MPNKDTKQNKDTKPNTKSVKDPKTKSDNKSENKSDKKNTSLRLDKKTLKALKIRAIEEETSVQKLIEQLIKDYLEKQ